MCSVFTYFLLPPEGNKSINSLLPSIDTHASFNDIQLFSCSLFLLFCIISLVSITYGTAHSPLRRDSHAICNRRRWPVYQLQLRMLMMSFPDSFCVLCLCHNRSKEVCPYTYDLPEGQRTLLFRVNVANKSAVDWAEPHDALPPLWPITSHRVYSATPNIVSSL